MITKEQEQYVIEHINDRPRTAVAKAAGISMATLYRIVRENGGVIDHSLSKRNPEWERIIRENYATMSGHEIERRFGITGNRANKIAHDLGLSHNEETAERIRAECVERITESKSRIDYKAISRKVQAKRRIDEMRVWEGKKPLYNYKLKSMPTKSYKAKWQLVNRYGYCEIENDAFAIGYDAETKRIVNRTYEHAKFNEDYYASKYGFRFERL